jgi:solute carrier family 25 2-oxodicarboxylate transporter 21
LNDLAAGTVGGFVGTAINTPYVYFSLERKPALLNVPAVSTLVHCFHTIEASDSPNLSLAQVVKSRIQGATRVPGIVPKYNWTYPAYASSILCVLQALTLEHQAVDNGS